jgi:hypothetical protein
MIVKIEEEQTRDSKENSEVWNMKCNAEYV